MRLFIAIELPDPVLLSLVELQTKLRSASTNVSWVQPKGIHCTLQFLGECPESQVPALVQRLKTVSGVMPFDLHVQGAGVFPSWSRPRVIWAGIKPLPPMLVALHAAVVHGMGIEGFSPETRTFHPHLTLGRFKSDDGNDTLLDMLRAESATFDGGVFRVSRFALIQSILQPNGAVYHPIDHFPIEG